MVHKTGRDEIRTRHGLPCARLSSSELRPDVRSVIRPFADTAAAWCDGDQRLGGRAPPGLQFPLGATGHRRSKLDFA
jgi:hypothetical protein